MQSIPAFQYKIKVHEDMMDAVHGGGENIKEIFIPSYQLIINSLGGLFNAEKPRNVQSLSFEGPEVEKPLTSIQLPFEFVEKIARVAKLKLEVSKLEKELAPDLKKVWK